MAIERTFSIVKPDAVAKGAEHQIHQMLKDGGLEVIATKRITMSQAQAQEFYGVHKERPFYGSLVEFMTSGPCIVAVLEGENAILRNRELMGATNPAEAAEGTIRKKYAANIENNAVHGSDAPETAAVEIKFFFPELS